MRTLRKKLIAATAMFVIAAMLLVSATVSFAWLSNRFYSGKIGFTTGEPSLTLEFAEINENKYAPFASEIIKPISNAGGYTIPIDQVNFGVIDNVAQLKPENVVYFRLTVPKSVGNQVALSLDYATEDFITIYGNDGEDVTNSTDSTNPTITKITEILTNLKDIVNQDGDSFLRYAVAVSNTAYEAKDIADNITFLGVNGSTDENHYYSLNKANETEDKKIIATTTMTNSEYEKIPEDGNYYVYIKVIPDLSVFAQSIEYIIDIMPCFMYFNISATFDCRMAEEVTGGGAE